MARKTMLVLGLVALAAALSPSAHAASTIETIQARGALRCGSNPVVGLAMPDATGRWKGFNVDLCRALAAAVLGDAERIDVRQVESKTRFQALSDDAIDVLIDGATMTLGRESSLGVAFPAVWLYDGQGFLAHRALGLKSIADAKGATICVADGTTSRTNVEEYVRLRKIDARVVVNQSDEGTWNAFLKGRCNVITNDRFGLLVRSTLHSSDRGNYVMLPETISKEPLSPAVRDGDERWFKLVRWVVQVLVAAEEKGLTAARIGSMPAGTDGETALLAGLGPDHAGYFGIPPGWARRAIESVGNYGEIFERHLGTQSPLRAERDQNDLWTRGGLMYAPPIR
ncbi:MAG: amino acid ABC transporter substrate-binding protein [Alphaproteobacteria bacterium]|nr:amino acid ABC transporter substrate-binding protein [Alphaproteobacteria bacterium]